ncbi:Glycerol-3-phosphate acyltransferase [subsurface metagenome]
MTIEFVLLILGAYLIGSIPAAYLVAKWFRGIDLRKYGSGNVGSSNLMRVTSKRLGIPVVIFDLGKGMIMVWIAQLVGLDTSQQVIVGLAAVIGHNWSVFLRFSAGRGALTTVGVALILVPRLTVVLLVITFGGLALGYMAVTTLCTIALLPIASWFSSAPVINWLFGQPLGISERLPVTLGFLAIFLTTVIRRLTAPRTSLSASVTTRQLIVNRLLFDRDIRDREAWIHRTPPKASLTKQQEKQGKG